MSKDKTPPETMPIVLAVDDDPAVLDVIVAKLTRHEYIVQTASSGEEALKILSESTPNVLILDVMMSGISGYDLCHIVKREERLKHIPVIFLTALGAPKDFETGHKLGAVIYMVKPFKPHQLLHVVQMFCSVPA
jgi:putative two-component system response regulator